MLARREHSYWELTKKLAQQYQADDIEQALSKLQSQNTLSLAEIHLENAEIHFKIVQMILQWITNDEINPFLK
jgi:hypothetical protein